MFDWDDANTAHIAEHGVLPNEAEEVISKNPLDIEYSIRNGEARLRQVGETLAGRILAIVSTIRNQRIRVITSYPASRALRGTYLQYKKGKDGKASSS
ncbi:MAG TPA: BrnT family toxin [Acidobacteriaceae bacterium]